ncbi:hypothetical protein MTQ01_09335 [Streptomyces sp. XM4193]|uniref:hypothetical protein n=1 Tax=Streptomyces sp. XM4193 TaxID=2929782 RepID=UPI001FF983AA|nr:hypothetical protein [Streptomyces sp. XM4193]MCK1796200.1 hypothetical protein [Streptomyces sp. XM4193]
MTSDRVDRAAGTAPDNDEQQPGGAAPPDPRDPCDQPTRASGSGPVPVDLAESAIVEHYARLVRLAHLTLPASMGRERRVLTAHTVVQRALPRGRAADDPRLPAQRGPGGGVADAGYAYVRMRVVRRALDAELPWRIGPLRLGRGPRPRLGLPRAAGLRLLPRVCSEDELALDRALSECSGEGRAAFALRALEGLSDDEVYDLLEALGVGDPDDALDEADEVPLPAGSRDVPPAGWGLDPSVLRARPTDLLRRRQHGRALVVGLAALAVLGVLLGLPGEGWGPSGAAAPAYAQNPAAQQALDPEKLVRVSANAWRKSARTDFSVWPARGELLDDTGLLSRALAVWARPGRQVEVTATPGTQTGPAAGPAQLLYAGEADGAALVLLHDGLRLVRYAEPAGGEQGPVGLDFARTDGADPAGSSAALLTRSDSNSRYLTAPWVSRLSTVDLLEPDDTGKEVGRGSDGVSDPLPAPPLGTGRCESWPALRAQTKGERPYLLTDLGEIVPARLTFGKPSTSPVDALSEPARRLLAASACQLPVLSGSGVRSVNSWQFGSHQLPENAGAASWVCTRADTWRGSQGQAYAQFRAPAPAGTQAAVVGRAKGGAECGARDPRALAGALWKSPGGTWYLLAVGSDGVTSITADGGVQARTEGRLMMTPVEQGAKAQLRATLADGGELGPLK